jgi:hypothetical protein
MGRIKTFTRTIFRVVNITKGVYSILGISGRLVLYSSGHSCSKTLTCRSREVMVTAYGSLLSALAATMEFTNSDRYNQDQ